MLKYKCLILDHDDTVVKTTAEIHYPSFKRTIEEVKPWIKLTERDFWLNCFDPGFFDYMEKKLGFTEVEMQYQLESWLKYIENKIPVAYDGVKEIILKQKELGGLVAVVSHSYPKIIQRDYSADIGILPDIIYGGDLPAEKRKPSVYPVEDILKRFSLKKEEVVVIDDSKPGLDMATAAGVDFICAGWSHCVEEIRSYMRGKCERYVTSAEELSLMLFGD